MELDYTKILSIVTLVVLNLFINVNCTRYVSPPCDGFKGILKYEAGKSYFYHYESHFNGFKYRGYARPHFDPNPSLKINATVVFTFSSECDVVLSIQQGVINSFTDAKGVPKGTIKLEKSFMKFFFNKGLVEYVHVNGAEPAWTQNIKRGILTMIQNSAAFTRQLKSHESSIYGLCETGYAKETGAKTINLTKCSHGEGSDLIFHGVPYQLPHVQNKQIFGALRPAHEVKCSQTEVKGILTETQCAEVGGGFFGMDGMKATLKYTHVASNSLSKADLALLTQRSTILYNFSTSGHVDKDTTKIENQLKLLKVEGSNKAEIFVELKKLMRHNSNLEKITKSDLLKEEIHRKAFYDVMAEVATDSSIVTLSKLIKSGGVDEMTQLKFFTTIAFATNPGPTTLSALSTLIKNIPKSFDEKKDPDFELKINVAEHLLLGASGLGYQYCRQNVNCVQRSEYVELVNDITDRVNTNGILATKKAAGTVELGLATLQALGNLPSLPPKAVKALEGILTSKAPEWFLLQALDAFRRDPCSANLKKVVRGILDDKKRSDQVRGVAYLALSQCLVEDDSKSIQEIFKTTSPLASFIATHVRSVQGSASPSTGLLSKSPPLQITVPKNILSVPHFTRASQFVDLSAFCDKTNIGGSARATIFFDTNELMPQFASVSLTADLFGRSFNFIEVGLSQRLLPKDRRGKSRGDQQDADWCCVEFATAAKDSYIRFFGTTVALGLDSIHETVQTSLHKLIKGQKTSWNLKAILPTTLVDEQLTFPSLLGLPLTFDLDAVQFDTADLDLSSPGQKDFETIMAKLFQSPFNYKVKVHAGISFVAQGGLALGTNTPISVGHRVKAKVHEASAFGLELTSGKNALMDLKIDFPEKVIDRKEVEVEAFSYQKVNGAMERLKNLDSKKAVVPSDKNHLFCHKCLLTGLDGCTSWYVDGSRFWYKSTVEKADLKMKGIEVMVKMDGLLGYKMSLTTPGSTVKRELNVAMSQGHGSVPKSAVVKVDVNGQLGESKHKGALTLEMTPSKVTSGFLFPTDYALVAEYASGKAKPSKVLKVKLTQLGKGKGQVIFDITGTLTGQVNVSVEPGHYRTDADIKIPVAYVEVTCSDDFRMSPNEMKRVIRYVVTDTKQTLKVTNEATLLLNMLHRSVQIDASSVATLKKTKHLTKFHANAKLPADLYNGKTTAGMTIESDGKFILAGSSNQTNSMTAQAFTSQLDFEIHSAAAKILTYGSKLKYDWHNANVKIYDFERQLSIEKKIKGTFLAPFDVIVTEDFGFYKETGKEVYVGYARNNITKSGILSRRSELNLRLSGDERGNKLAKLNGFSKDAVMQNNLLGTWTGRSNFVTGLKVSNLTLDVTRSPVTGKGKVEQIFTQSVNHSLAWNDTLNLKFNEDGWMKFLGDHEVDWRKEVKVLPKEVRLFEEIKEKHGGKNSTFKTIFLLDITARLYQENGHPVLGMTARQTKAETQAFNLTISQ